MSKNLVIVESPAKARTIERYLGPGYRVLASYGHVRDLPENPGKNKLGVDVEHDFKPDYVVQRGPQEAGRGHRQGGEGGRHGLSGHRPRPRRRGDRLACRGGGERLAREGAPRDFSRDHQDAIKDAFAHPRDIDHNLVDAQQTRRILDRLVGYTLSPLLWRKVRRGCPPAACSRSPCAWSWSASARSARSPRASTGRSRPLETARRRRRASQTFVGHAARDRRQESLDRRRWRRPMRHATALATPSSWSTSVNKRSAQRNPRRPFTTSTLQQEASRKLGFNRQAHDARRPAACTKASTRRTAASA